MKRLPGCRWLATKILNTPYGRGTLNDSSRFLVSKNEELRQFKDLEELQSSATNCAKGGLFHLKVLRDQLAHELWSRHFYIGPSVLDDLLFAAVWSKSSNPVLTTLQNIRDARLNQPGLLVFPLHSFGVLDSGASPLERVREIRFSAGTSDFVLAPQTNSFDGTLELLRRASELLGVRKRIESDSLQHCLESRSASWLTRNPLLILKIHMCESENFENQFFMVSQVKKVASFLMMMAALQGESVAKRPIFSTSRKNNDETLDIRHYLTFHQRPVSRQALEAGVVPMHLDAPALSELSDLPIDYDLNYWRLRRKLEKRVYASLIAVHDGYISQSVGSGRNQVKGRLYRKLFEATSYFRRSFHTSDSNWSAIISLAIAFEMLLTDFYAKGVGSRIEKRTKQLLKNQPQRALYVKAVKELYETRGKAVHSGVIESNIDLTAAQKAFVFVFVALVERLPVLSPTTQTPIKDLVDNY